MNAAVAGHEARHCAAALLLGLPVAKATAISDGRLAGSVSLDLDELEVDPELVRRLAFVLLAGAIDEASWPPAWPSAKAQTPDERGLATLVDYLDLDESGWRELITDAFCLFAEHSFTRLEQPLALLLEEGHVLDQRTLKHVHAISEKKMERLTLKTVTTTTDEGLFTAVISTQRADREKDVVSAAGMVAALKKWNRPIPLAWEHSTKAEDIFGVVDPQSAREVGGEVVVDGEVDLESAVGKEAWRSFKARSLGFSFAYLTLQSTKRPGGGRNITAMDVYEITATPTPMNNNTRVVSAKSTKQVAEQETEQEPVGVIEALNEMIDDAQEFIDQEDDPADIAIMRRALDALQSLVTAETAEDEKGLREIYAALKAAEPRGKTIGRNEKQPVTVASFEC